MPFSQYKAVTRAQVAREAGVSEATVSLALHGSGKIRPETRDKVEAVAERLGYQINAAASLLAGNRRHASAGLRVAILTSATSLGRGTHFKEAATAAGLSLDILYANSFSSPKEAGRVLWARGYTGLLLDLYRNPWPAHEIRDFPWEKFSLVKISRTLPEVPCTLVRHSPYDFCATALERTFAAGFDTLAVLLMRSPVPRDDDARLGALLTFQKRHPVKLTWKEIEPAEYDRSSNTFAPKVERWLRAQLCQPRSALIAYHWSFYYGLKTLGSVFPGDHGLAAILSTSTPVPDTPAVTGCDANQGEVTLRATRLLASAIGLGQRGLPLHPVEHVVSPVWLPGETLLPPA